MATDLRTTDPPEAMVEAPIMDVPDLVLPTAPTSKPALRPAVSARPPVAPTAGDAFDDDFQPDLQIDLSAAAPKKAGIARPPTPGAGFSPFDDDIAAGPSIELDTVGGSVPGRVSSPNISIGPAPSNPSLPPERPSQRSLAPVAPAPPSADPFEARVLADYGPAPDAFWRSPFYAYRVMTRRAELRRALAVKKEEAERTSKRVEDALVAFGERARVIAQETAGKNTAALERVRAAEELLKSRDGALAGTLDAHKATVGEIDVRLGAAENEFARAKEEEGRVDGAREAAAEDEKRAEAKLKRIEIEIRNGGADRAAERDTLGKELAQKSARRAEADQKLAEAKRASSTTRAKLDAVTAERTAQEARFGRQSGARNAGVEDAQTQLRSALADLGREMLADTSLTALARAREEVARLEEQSQSHHKSVALHESAIVSFDPGKVFLGVGLVLVGLVLLGVLLGFPFIYRALAT